MKQTTQHPEVVLMDIDMPTLNGIETVAISSSIYPQTKFLMLTVFDDEEKTFESIKAGASGYLLKDEKPETISPVHAKFWKKAVRQCRPVLHINH